MKRYLSHLKGKRVLVTGGAGAIGSSLVKRLLECGAFVIVIDNLSSGFKWLLPESENLLFIEGDITDDIDLKRIFNEEPDFVFHLAAFFANQNSVDYPEIDLKINGFGTLKLLEYTRIYGNVQRFVYASAGCAIYDPNASLPLTEDKISLHQSSPYQITKVLGELYCNYFQRQYGLPTVKIRFFNSYGPGEVPGQYRNVIPNFIYWAKLRKPLPITGTGEETRDFTYVGDVVDGILRMGYFKEAIGEEMNLASGKEVKTKYLAETVNKLTKNKAGVKHFPRRTWDAKVRLVGSNEKARRIIGFKPEVGFDEGLKKTIKWFDDNWENIKKSADFNPGMSSAVRTYKK